MRSAASAAVKAAFSYLNFEAIAGLAVIAIGGCLFLYGLTLLFRLMAWGLFGGQL